MNKIILHFSWSMVEWALNIFYNFEQKKNNNKNWRELNETKRIFKNIRNV